VVVTGIGVVTPIGSTKETFWESLISGNGGIGPITRIDASEFPSRIAGEAKGFDPLTYLERKEIRHMDPFCQFAIGAAVQAVNDSGIDFDLCDRDRAGVIIGSGIGGMYAYESQHKNYIKRGFRRISPFFITMLIADLAAGHISIHYNLRGPNYAITSACATSAHSIGCAMKAIRYGDADIMVTGGAEAPITSMGIGGFCAMKALSTRNDAAEKASRPFDKERDGFIVAEGGGIIILEELEHAKARDAHIYCELVGAGFTGDAFHITAPPEDGDGAARAMQIAMQDAGLEPHKVEYVNAHGTSTPLNDAAETKAIKKTFGDHAYKLIISSTKSMHGHMLGAAGAVELTATILAMERNTIPPTINYEYPDPECDLNYTPNEAVKRSFDVALCNSFGFGGHNVSLVVRRYL